MITIVAVVGVVFGVVALAVAVHLVRAVIGVAVVPVDPSSATGPLAELAERLEAQGFVGRALAGADDESRITTLALTAPDGRSDLRATTAPTPDGWLPLRIHAVSSVGRRQLVTSSSVGLPVRPEEVVQVRYRADADTVASLHVQALDLLAAVGVDVERLDAGAAGARFIADHEAEQAFAGSSRWRLVRTAVVALLAAARVRQFAAPIRPGREARRVQRLLTATP